MKNIERTKIGDITLTAVNDYTELITTTDFFPSLSEKKIKELEIAYPGNMQEGKLIFPYFSCIIQDGKDLILVDAGVGGKQTGRDYDVTWEGNLLGRIEEAGYHPGDFTHVVFSHIHGDHIGWATTLNDGKYVKTFPNAKYLVHRADYDAFCNNITKPFIPAGCVEFCLEKLVQQGKVVFVNETQYALSQHIQLIQAPGHTPGAMYVKVSINNETAIWAGDCISGALQISEPECDYFWDIDKARAFDIRKSILQDIGKDGSIVGAAHMGLGMIYFENEKMYWREIGNEQI